MTNKTLIEAARRASNDNRGVDLFNYRGGLLTKLADALEKQEWRSDMDNAPRDEQIILGRESFCVIAEFDGEGWYSPEDKCRYHIEAFSRWKPLDIPDVGKE